jgi:hypothetical protein
VLIVDLQGYELQIENEVERRNLIKDARFYNLRHLTETLLPAKTFHNPFRGSAAEILISLADFKPSNSQISWVSNTNYGWMEYKRPHEIDTAPRDLLVQMEDDGLIVGGGKIMLVHRQQVNAVRTLKDMAEGRKTEIHPSVLMGGKMEVAVKIEVPDECDCTFDGKPLLDLSFEVLPEEEAGPTSKKRKLNEDSTASDVKEPPRLWHLKRSIWRVKVRNAGSNNPAQTTATPRRVMILVAARLEGWSREREFSKELGWL